MIFWNKPGQRSEFLIIPGFNETHYQNFGPDRQKGQNGKKKPVIQCQAKYVLSKFQTKLIQLDAKNFARFQKSTLEKLHVSVEVERYMRIQFKFTSMAYCCKFSHKLHCACVNFHFSLTFPTESNCTQA